MKSFSEGSTVPKGPPLWIILVRALSLAGLALSAYLLWGSLTQDHLPGCGFESGCNLVLHSRWASWFGLPVSGFALLIYVLVLAASWILQNTIQPLARSRVECVMITAAVALGAAAIWFIGLQLFVVRAICPFCMAAHACGLLTSVLLLANVPRASSGQAPAGSATRPVGISMARLATFAFGGLAPVIILSVGQVLQPIKTYDVQPIATNALAMTNVVVAANSSDRSSASANSKPPVIAEAAVARPHRILQLHGDIFSLDLHEVPLHGSPDATNVIVHLFDYSCKHCRELHPILSETVHGLGNQVAVVSLPMPLDAHCNPIMQRVIPDHTNACAYARTGLAVWRANPARLEEFDDWIFSPERPPMPDAVRSEAMRLVGTNAFEAALRDPWIDQQLNLSMRLYQTNFVRYRKSQLPEMMIGTNIFSGVPPNVGAFSRFLAAKFDLQLPDATAR